MLKKSFFLFFVFTIILKAQVQSDKNVDVCNSKFQIAIEKKLFSLPIGDVIAAVGKSFIGTDYSAHSLDKDTAETLVINLTGLDCTTYLENVLAISRCIKEKKTTFDDFKNELAKIRYRNGIINGYPSRLHYFSDWIYDNEKKGILKNISEELGGRPIKFNVYFMSTHPESYIQLKENPSFISSIKKYEEEISGREYFYIPKENIAAAEKKIYNGDMIAFTTNIKGLDISHVGFAVKAEDGRIHLMHAPNVGYKVQISDEPLSVYISKIKKDTGIIILRALEPADSN